MRLLTEYLSINVKASIIHADDKSLNKIIYDEIQKFGLEADLNHIDVSKCTTLDSTFDNMLGTDEIGFYGDVSKWKTHNIQNMSNCFKMCRKFNCDISDWETGNVKHARLMFGGCFEFNQPLNNWNTENFVDTNKMFYACKKFNQPLYNWKTSKIIDMEEMFGNCENFNQDLSKWEINKAISWNDMFKNCPIKDEYLPMIK